MLRALMCSARRWRYAANDCAMVVREDS